MYNLFLDDIRVPENVDIYKEKSADFFVIVRSYDEFIKYISKNGLPELIAFDYVLSYVNGKTGLCALTWLCEYIKKRNLNMPEMTFHSSSKGANKKMKKYLHDFTKKYTK